MKKGSIDTEMLVNQLAECHDENPKAKVRLEKLTQVLHVVAKRMNERGYCHSDNGVIGMVMDNIKQYHPQAYPFYDIKVRELMCHWLDCARY